MADISIYNGSSSFSSGQTPFGFYDTDSQFQSDADKVVKFCATRLGYPIMDVELQPVSFYSAFEEAVNVYGNEVYNYKIRENYMSIEGSSTGTYLNNKVQVPSLGTQIRIANMYGSEAGVGGYTHYYSASIKINVDQQVYDLSSVVTGSIEIKRVFHEAPPAITRYFDPYATTGLGFQGLLDNFGFGSMSPSVNFMLMPVYYDMLKIQAIEFNDQIRKSGYSFEVIDNILKIFPRPLSSTNLWFEYINTLERDAAYIETAGSKVTNISNVPYSSPVYSQINPIGKQWIYQYTLALTKEMLGLIRGKYSTTPIPGNTVNINYADLLSTAASEKTALIEALRATLDDTSRKNQLEKKQQESQFLKDTLGGVPLPIYIY
jgi:hypothetical protein